MRAFDLVRVELDLDDGVGVWERRLSGPGVVAIGLVSGWTGSARVWAVDSAAPAVVAYGEADAGRGAAFVSVDLRAAADVDRDWVVDATDVCPTVSDPAQHDGDGDGVGDACDVCPHVRDPEQIDSDGDGAGDACDPPQCGNLAVDPGEACDDGNLVTDDACSNDCFHLGMVVEIDGPPDGMPPHLVELPSGALVAGWVETDPSGISPDRTLAVAPLDATSGRIGSPSFHVRADAVLVGLGAIAGAGGDLRALWVEPSGVPGGAPRRLVAASLPGGRFEGGAVETLAVGEWPVAWAFPPLGPPIVAVHGAASRAPGAIRWFDLGAWPPRVLGDAAPALYADPGIIAGAHRRAGGRLLVWSARHAERAGERSSLWARRFDDDGVPVDPDPLLLGDVGSCGNVAASHHVSSDTYRVVVLGCAVHSGNTLRFRLDAGSGAPPSRPTIGDPRTEGFTGVAHLEDGGELVWRFEREPDRCGFQADLYDADGRFVVGGARHDVERGVPVMGCDGTVAVLSDGRVAVVWTRIGSTPMRRTGHVGMLIAPSVESLFPI